MPILLPYCKICFGPRDQDGVCNPCRDEIERCRRDLPVCWLATGPGGGYRRTAIFYYEHVMRRLILRVKIRGDLVALSTLLDLFTEQTLVRDLVAWSEVVVAAPSSLWGRLRGKIDLAHALSLQVSKQHQRPLVAAPWQLFWRYQKRARLESSLRRQDQPQGTWSRILRDRWLRTWCPALVGRRVLLIDDISTSGVTLLETALGLQLAEPDETRMLVLATPRL